MVPHVFSHISVLFSRNFFNFSPVLRIFSKVFARLCCSTSGFFLVCLSYVFDASNENFCGSI